MAQAPMLQATASAVTQDGEFLEIWAQKDPHFLAGLEDSINKLIQTPNVFVAQDPSEIKPNLSCYALFSDCKWYRARVKNIFSSLASIHAIDYGFDFCVDYRNLRLLRMDDPFKTISPAAERFYLAGLLVRGTLSQDELNSLQKNVLAGNPVYITIVAQNRATGSRFVTVHNHSGMNYVDAWKRHPKLEEIQLAVQDQLMTEKMAAAPPGYLRLPTASTSMAHILPLPVSLSPTISPVPVIQQAPRPVAAHSPEPRFLVTPPPPKALKVGATYRVTVSDATNGPWSFSIQLADEAKLLERLNEEIQRIDKVSIRAPFNIGRPCIVFHPIQKVYSRSILVSEGDRSAVVAFIDYGDSATMNIREVFEMPQNCLKTPQLSQKFRLAELPAMKPGTEEYLRVITIFRKIISIRDEQWFLKATQTEEGCSQNCELYDAEGDSIKALINEEKRKQEMAYTADDFPEVGQTVPVYISHVNDSTSFFVQTKLREDDCVVVQEALKTASVSAARLLDIRVNVPCMAQFEDGDWYRARVTSFDQTKANLSFVDYGNETVMDLKNLKELPRKLIMYPSMALHCCLESRLPDERTLQNLLNDESVEARVIRLTDDKMLVKILHSGQDIAAPKPQSPPVMNTYSAPVPVQPAADDGWHDNNTASYWQNDPPPGRRRKDSGSSGDYRRNTIRDRFAARDADRRRLPADSGGMTNGYQSHSQPSNDIYGGRRKFNDAENSRGFKNRCDENGEGGFRSRQNNDGGFKKFGRENGGEDGGFKKFGDDDGGFKKFGGDDGGFKSFGNEEGGGFRKRRDDGGKFGGGDGNTRPDRPMRAPIRYDERAPAGAEWTEQTIDPGTEWDVLVTYYITPDNFYVQQSSPNDAFVAMVEGIQTDYNNKFSFKKTEPPQVPDIVVAKFSEDRVLYRAQVTVAEPLTVRFVDYGNVDKVNDGRDVYPVMSKLLDLPKQAVRCKLAGVKPAGESWSSNVDDYFDKGELKCTFVSVEDGVHVVKLTYDGQDVSEQLKQAGLASGTDDGAAATATASTPAATAAPADVNPPKPELPRIIPSLLAGDSALVKISYIEGVERFFVHPDLSANLIMEDLVAKAELKPFSGENPVGVYCIAGLADDSRYRAQGIEIDESDGDIWVHFIDYGDSQKVPMCEIFDIPENLRPWPPLAIECALHGDISQVPDDAQDKFKAEFELQNVVINCHSLREEDDSLIVTVYDERGVKVKIDGWVNEEAGVSAIPQLVLPASKVTVNVLQLTGPHSCLISLPGVTQPDMNAFYTDMDDSLQVEAGSRCAVKSADGTWRRTVRPTDGECYLIDVGRSELATEFRPLAPQFVTVPASVREVTLKWPVLGNQLVKVTRKEETYEIEPVVKSVMIAHVESASEIYVHSESVLEIVDQVGVTLSTCVNCDVEGAVIFAAKFADDEQWYRAQAIEPAEPLTVRFIDYGNSAEVTEIAPLPAELLNLPPLAKRVQLHAGLPETDEVYTTLTELSEIALQLIEENGMVVDLLLDGVSLADKILKRRPLKAGSKVYLAYVDSPGHFYLHRDEDFAQLEILTEKLEASITDAAAVEATEGKLVAAKSVDDDAWYRAVIESNMVFFIDYGNKAELSDLRELPTEFVEIYPLAVKARIIHPNGTEWSQSALDALSEMVDSRSLIVQKATWQDGAYSVVLTEEGADIISKLITEDEMAQGSVEAASSSDAVQEEGAVVDEQPAEEEPASDCQQFEGEIADPETTVAIDSISPTEEEVADTLVAEEEHVTGVAEEIDANEPVAEELSDELADEPAKEEVGEEIHTDEPVAEEVSGELADEPTEEVGGDLATEEILADEPATEKPIDPSVTVKIEQDDDVFEQAPEVEAEDFDQTCPCDLEPKVVELDDSVEILEYSEAENGPTEIIDIEICTVDQTSDYIQKKNTYDAKVEEEGSEMNENGASEQCSEIPEESTVVKAEPQIEADAEPKPNCTDIRESQEVAEVEPKPNNETDSAKATRKNDDSLSDTVGDVSRSPATDKDSSGVESEGFNEEPTAKLIGDVTDCSTSLPAVKLAKKTVEDKIVPGSICRGVYLFESPPK